LPQEHNAHGLIYEPSGFWKICPN